MPMSRVRSIISTAGTRCSKLQAAGAAAEETVVCTSASSLAKAPLRPWHSPHFATWHRSSWPGSLSCGRLQSSGLARTTWSGGAASGLGSCAAVDTAGEGQAVRGTPVRGGLGARDWSTWPVRPVGAWRKLSSAGSEVDADCISAGLVDDGRNPDRQRDRAESAWAAGAIAHCETSVQEEEQRLLAFYKEQIELCGQVQPVQWWKAQKLFQSMDGKGVRKDVEVYNLLIDVYVHAGKWSLANELVSQMQRSGLQPDLVTLSSLISFSRRAEQEVPRSAQLLLAERAFQLFAHVHGLGHLPPGDLYQALLRVVVQGDRVKESLRVYDAMLRAGVAPDLATCRRLVESCEKNRQFKKAFAVFLDMQRLGVVPDLPTYNSLLGSLARSGQCEEALQVAAHMRQQRVQEDALTLRHLVWVCQQQGDWQRAMAEYSRMCPPGAAKCAPDAETFQRLLGVLHSAQMPPAADAADEELSKGKVRKAGSDLTAQKATIAKHTEKVFKAMQRLSLQNAEVVDVSSCNHALEVFAAAERWTAVEEVVEQMRQHGPAPDARTFRLFLQAVPDRDWETAWQTLLEMQECAVVPDVESYDRMIVMLMRGKQWGKALRVLEDMQRTGTTPTLQVYKRLLKVCQHGARGSQAVRVLQDMQHAGVAPTPVLYRRALGALRQEARRNARAAWALFRSMTDAGLAPTLPEYNEVLRQLAMEGDHRAARAVLDDMRARAVRPDEDSYAWLVRSCEGRRWAMLHGAQVRAAMQLLHEMVEDGLHPHLQLYDCLLSVCSKGREWTLVLEAFQAMQNTGYVGDREHCAVVINACHALSTTSAGSSKADDAWRKAVEVYADMQQRSIAPYERTHRQVLELCRQAGEWERALEVMWAMQEGEGGAAREPGTFQSLVQGMAREEGAPWAAALAAYERLQARGPVALDLATYVALLRLCNRGRQWQMAFQLLEGMRGAGVEPDQAVYQALVHACRDAGQWEQAIDLLGLMRSRGFVPGLSTFQSAILACKDAAQCQPALKVYEQMRAAGVAPGLEGYTTLLSLCATARRPHDAWRLFEDALEAGVQPDQMLFGSLVHACARGKDWGRVRRALELMPRHDLAPNVVVYNALIDGYGKAGQWQQALRVREEMQGAGVPPDAGTYSSLIQACSTGGKQGHVKRLFQEMLAAGIAPNTVVYSQLIATFAAEGNVDWAFRMFDDMRSAGAAPNEVTYNGLIHACIKGRQMPRAFSVFDDMRQQGLQPDVYTYSSLISGCAKAKQGDKALGIFQDMRRLGVSPDLIAYNSLMNALSRQAGPGSIDRVFEVFEDMCQNRIVPDIFSYTAVMKVCAMQGEVGRALAVYEEMKAQGVAADARMFTSLMTACRRAGQPDRALDLLQEMRAVGVKADSKVASAVTRACEGCGRWEEALQAVPQRLWGPELHRAAHQMMMKLDDPQSPR